MASGKDLEAALASLWSTEPLAFILSCYGEIAMRAIAWAMLAGCIVATGAATGAANAACPSWLSDSEPDTKIDEFVCNSGRVERSILEVLRFEIDGYGTFLVEGLVYQKNKDVARGARIVVGPYGKRNSNKKFLLDEDEVIALGGFLDEAINLSARLEPANTMLTKAVTYRSRDNLKIRGVQGELGGLHIEWYEVDLILQPDQASRLRDVLISLTKTLATISSAEAK